jgi:hypothetical protein
MRSLQVLIREEEIVSEDVRSKPAPSVQSGDRAFQKHISKSRTCALYCAIIRVYLSIITLHHFE